jgi:two-component system NtrC family sensor kinase
MSNEQIILLLSDQSIAELIERTTLRPAGYETIHASDADMVIRLVKRRLPDVLIVSTNLNDGSSGIAFAQELIKKYASLAVILFANQITHEEALDALRAGICDYLSPPLRTNDVLQAVRLALTHRKRLQEWARRETRRGTSSLRRQVANMEALSQINRKVTSSLQVDQVLSAVIDAAVDLTEAEHGSLLLMDENSGELYMRAARNLKDDFVRTFRIPINDTLPGEVLRTRKPLLVDKKSSLNVKTANGVHSLIYVPMMAQGSVVGVLGVDNRHDGKDFDEDHLSILTSLADYAAIAVENARLFTESEQERSKLETLLRGIQDGVVVIDSDKRLILINQAARDALGLQDEDYSNHPITEILRQEDLLEIFKKEQFISSCRSEINMSDGRVFNAQFTPIPDVGLAVIMQDITYLKELDRIKSDFVNTVSHDLRSPLTAILGYVELIEHIGPLNAQQKNFINRIQASVESITSLINDLLDLGRIEAGFDSRNEIVPIAPIIQFSLESFQSRVDEKKQTLNFQIERELPPILGNPLRLRQMISNLVGNAIKYTPENGNIQVNAHHEDKQLIFEVSDNGPGISQVDQPYIFDKFYRGSNVPTSTPGTGLGLSIVKSIVENHQGRIWVKSAPNRGTTFTVVLPVSDQEL